MAGEMNHDHSGDAIGDCVKYMRANSTIVKTVRRPCPPVTHEQARASAQRFIDQHFNNRGMLPQTSIPVRPDDDDVVLMCYIEEQSEREPLPRTYPLDEDCISPADVPGLVSPAPPSRIEQLERENERLARIVVSKCHNIEALQHIIEASHRRASRVNIRSVTTGPRGVSIELPELFCGSVLDLSPLWVSVLARKPAQGLYRLTVGGSGYRRPAQFCTLACWEPRDITNSRWLDVQGEDLDDCGFQPEWWLDLDLKLPPHPERR